MCNIYNYFRLIDNPSLSSERENKVGAVVDNGQVNNGQLMNNALQNGTGDPAYGVVYTYPYCYQSSPLYLQLCDLAATAQPVAAFSYSMPTQFISAYQIQPALEYVPLYGFVQSNFDVQNVTNQSSNYSTELPLNLTTTNRDHGNSALSLNNPAFNGNNYHLEDTNMSFNTTSWNYFLGLNIASTSFVL